MEIIAMKGMLIFVLSIISLSLFTANIVQAEDQKPMEQTYTAPPAKIGDHVICPVMKTPITVSDKTLAVEIKDKKYYVCCGGCVKLLKSDPDKYLTPKEN